MGDHLILENSQMSVIFDMDGVIIDSAPCHYAAWQTIWKRKGIPFTLETFKHYFACRSDMHVRLIAGDDLPVEEVMAIVKEKESLFREFFKNGVKVLLGAVGLIQSFHKHGWKMAIGSSAPFESVQMVLDLLDIRKYFDAVATGSDVTQDKPSPQIFLTAARKLGVNPGNCLVIEDAVVGVQAAKRGGMYALAVTNTHPREAFGDADLIVASLEEVTVESLGLFLQSKGLP